MFNNIDVYNRCIHQLGVDLGQKVIGEIVLEQVAKAKDQLKLGEVTNAADHCFGIILGIELANRDIEDDEGRYLQQARAEACVLVSYFPIKKDNADEFCLASEYTDEQWSEVYEFTHIK